MIDTPNPPPIEIRDGAFKLEIDGDGDAELTVPGWAVTVDPADDDRAAVMVPGELIDRLLRALVADAEIAADPPGTLDLDLLRRFASGEGGRRTSQLAAAGLLEWKVTPRGVAALNAASIDVETETKLVTYAREELQRAGLFDEDADYGGALGERILATVRAFSGGHSGGSAMIAITALERILRWQPLTPLTSDPSEWTDVTEMTGYPLWQSKRKPSAFSHDGGESWYDVEQQPDALSEAIIVVRRLYPGRQVEQISRVPGFDRVEIRFADGGVVPMDGITVRAEGHAARTAGDVEPPE